MKDKPSVLVWASIALALFASGFITVRTDLVWGLITFIALASILLIILSLREP